MADKKVERTGRERPITPTQKMEAALSDPGTTSMADTTRDKGKSALADKFREREERWRRDQALHDQQAAQAAERIKPGVAESKDAVDRAKEEDTSEGGSNAAEPVDRGRGGGS